MPRALRRIRSLFLLLATCLALWAQPAPFPRDALRGPGGGAGFENLLETLQQWIGPELPDWTVRSSRFLYRARRPLYGPSGDPLLDGLGQPRTEPALLSGRIFLPPPWRLEPGSRIPLVVYAHATALNKHAVASEFGGREWVLAAAAATWYGFAVAMPDLPGMGVDAGRFHPFCHAKSLAYATVDALAPLIRLLGEDPLLRAGACAWDGRLFLIGYSEGAYTALASVKELETHAGEYAAWGIRLTGSACMAGPFDLSGLARADIINPLREYAHGFFLPYMIRGFHEVYGPAVDPRQAFAPVLLDPREDGDILQWIQGDRNGLEVDERIAARLGKPAKGTVFRELLNPAWLARELDDPAYEGSLTHRLLRENDLHRGWTPTRPILFAQSPCDQDLPYQNTVAAMGYLAAEIQKAGGDPGSLLASIPIGDCRDRITHVEGALVAVPAAFDWIHRGMPMDR